MLEVTLTDRPTPVPNVAGLSAMNIDPEAAAENYRTRVLEQLGPEVTASERSTVREQLSGACTTEIAAFDEFVGLLDGDMTGFDHIIFDTAPTGHTLRLLSLPKAWTGFLRDNDRGASCLGPHSGLKMQEDRFRKALRALGDSEADYDYSGHPRRPGRDPRGRQDFRRTRCAQSIEPAARRERTLPRHGPNRCCCRCA